MLAMARYGTRDIARAKQFYDAIGEIIGAQRVVDRDDVAAYKGPSGGRYCEESDEGEVKIKNPG